MRFPSISFVGSEAAAVFRRFPVVLLFAFVATVAGILAFEEPEHEDLLVRLICTATLGLPLSVALTIAPDKRGWGIGPRVLLHLAGLAALAAFFAAWPHWQDPAAFRRYVQFSLGFHLLAAFLPFARAGERNGFWQYNKALFLRFLLAALYAGVLYGGLAVAVLALDKLFGLDVDGERYGQLWVLIAFLFTTWFFLGGVPRDLNRLDAVTDYPRGLRIFSQFILLPLVGVYLVILTLYMGKIAITREWPSGWIGYLVSSVAAVGILLLLLVFPVQEREENRWVRTYSRWFYVILLPSIAMLLLAIFKRTGQYGLTENRYFMVVLAFWLAAVALYFIFSRGKSIKVIPATLCVLAFVTAFGPWGAYRMSARSQTERLRHILEDHGMFAGGRFQGPAADVPAAGMPPAGMPFEDRQQVSAILSYLLETHGTDPIAGWFEDGLAWADTVGGGKADGRWRAGLATKEVMEAMGLPYADPRAPDGRDRRVFSFPPQGPLRAVSISGYDHAFNVENLNDATVELEGDTVALVYEMETVSLRLEKNRDEVIRIPLREAIGAAYGPSPRTPGTPPPEAMTIRAENARAAVLVQVLSLYGNTTEAGPEVTGFSGMVFIRFGPE